MCNCLLLFKMYFIMWNLFLSWSECSLWWCPWWSIAKSCMIPFFCKFIGLNFILMFLARFLFFWIGVLILRLEISEFSAICFYDWFSIDIVSLLFAWIFDSNNCLAWNSLCESRDMLLEQCLKQCLWTVILQTIILFLKLALYQ